MSNKPNRAEELFEPRAETVTETPSAPAPQAQGSITVAVGLPGKLKAVPVPTGSTIQDVLMKVGMNPEGMDVSVDGHVVRDLNTPLRDGETVMLFRPVAGNK